MNGNEASLRLSGIVRPGLLLVDVQNDFLPGGSLAVPLGDEIIAPLNACIGLFIQANRPIFATRDWHPPKHCSFRERGGPWPAHCVAGSFGARFAAGLALPATAHIISKATDPEREAYSGFAGTDLVEGLRAEEVDSLFVGGLATDYCVRLTVLDALGMGFRVYVLEDAVRTVGAGAGGRALAEMRARGAVVVLSDWLVA